jgi:hypothetical protein
MKKIILAIAVLTVGCLSAQTFTDNFDSYNLSYLGPQSNRWTTWSGVEGGTEDVQVTNNNASSGTKSLYFSSTAAGGGPQDVVLPFDQVYNSGNFTFEANFFVEANKGAYFNLQGTLVVAQVWALDCYMLQDGTLKLKNGSTSYITANYPPAQWFNLRIEMDLSSNIWQLFVNNVSQGSFSNPTGQIGILDLYPVNPTNEGGNNISGYYVDDVSYNHIPATLPAVNGGVTFVNQLSGISGLSSPVKATVRNLGSNAISSYDISYTYGGTTITENVTGQNIASLGSMDYTFTNNTTVLPGINTLTVTISNVNGAGQDANVADDSKSITTDPIVPATGKIVVGEEGTGTWCPWCPRGTVYMDLFEETYGPYWAGIAVHNADPMTVTDYDAAIGPLLGGYPNALVDRGTAVDPSAMNAQFLNRLQTPPVGVLTNTAVWEPSTRTLTVNVKTDFMLAANNNYKLACVLTEDGVTGTTAGYAQANAYAGGANGVMGGYELLPSTVPAAQMVYDHVARIISPSFDGAAVFPSVVNPNDSHTEVFTFILPETWNVSNMHIVSMLIAPNGSIDNAGKATISQAASVAEAVKDNFLAVYPNPTNKELNISYTNGKVDQINILTLDGKTVISKKITSNYLTTDVSSLKAGMYIVEVISQNNSIKEVFIKQ